MNGQPTQLNQIEIPEGFVPFGWIGGDNNTIAQLVRNLTTGELVQLAFRPQTEVQW